MIAYALLEVKTQDAARRRIAGVATTPTPDRHGDVIDPLGVKFANPIPLLLHHDQTRPVGRAWFEPATADGIAFTAELPHVADPGAVKDRVDEAWQSLTAGLISGASIGFRPRPPFHEAIEPLSTGGLRYKATEVCELSLVTVPANTEASIHVVKALDAPHVAAIGHPPAGVTAFAIPAPMTIQEQVTALETKRATTVAAMHAMMTRAGDGGQTFTEEEQTQYDGLAAELRGLDGQLERARVLETANKSAARPVTPIAPGTPAPAFPIRNTPPEAPGRELVLAAMCLCRSRGDRMLAIEFAKELKQHPNVELYLKAAIAPGTVQDPAWAGALVPPVAPIANQFLDLLRPQTIIGRIPGLRRVPFNTYLPRVTDGGSVGWVGEGVRKKVTKQAFDRVQILEAKAAAIVVLTEELVRRAVPDAITTVQSIMIATMVQFLDQQFIDPTVAAVANVHPASITNGLTAIPSTGDPFHDLATLLGTFAGNNIPLAGLTVIMSDQNALALSLMRSSAGTPLFPNMSITGGTLPGGITTITSTTAGSNVIALVPSLVMFAEEGILLDISREASVEMSDAPDGTGGLLSLWQANMIGLRVERYINWQRARDQGVNYLSGVAYQPTLTTPAVPPSDGPHTAKHSAAR